MFHTRRWVSWLVVGLLVSTTFASEARGRAGRRPRPAVHRLVGLILSSGQALVWDGTLRRYRLLRVGDRFRGARVIGLGVDRLLAERRGTKFIWKLGAPLLVNPSGKAVRRPGAIISLQAPPPPRPEAQARRATRLPPVPRSADEPERHEVWRRRLPLSVLSGLVSDFVKAQREMDLQRQGRTLRITYLRPKGRLAAIGLAIGDRVLRIQGRSVITARAAAEIYAALRPGHLLRVELTRGDRRIDLRIRLR